MYDNNFQMRSLDLSRTPVQEFYNDTVVFITGATGFVGKLLVEKLLRSCSGIQRMYLLIRSKRDKTPEQRLEELFQEPIFERLENEWPKFRQTITILHGDCDKSNLGLSDQDLNIITTQVNIVFHNAATVRFNEKLKIATLTNLMGTKELIEICKQCEHLKAVVHVSTAYSYSIYAKIEEQFYEPDRDPEQFIEYIKETDSEILDKLTPSILGKYPNTYAYTKALAEEIIRKNKEELPIVIVRPSIVLGIWKEPIPGWTDNLYGPTGMLLGCGAGLIRAIRLNDTLNTDLIPVDMLVNTLITAAWDRGQNKNSNKTEVLNYVSSARNPLTWGNFIQWNMHFGQMFPLSKSLWYCTIICSKHKYLFYIYRLFLHTIPGYLVDFISLLMGKKPKLIKIYDKIHLAEEMLSYFSTHQWEFRDDNVQKLWHKLSDSDKQIFPFNVLDLEWDRYFFNNIKSIRFYLAKDQDSTLQMARIRMARFKLIHNTIKFAFVALITYFFYTIIFKFCF